MRLDPVLDSFYLLGSLWGALTGSAVCPSSARSLPRGAHESVRTSVPGAGAAVTAFVDVNVIPMDTERVLTTQTVLAEGGRITALGPSGTVRVPPGAVRIDGRGRYLIPGLTDMHAHSYFETGNYDKLAPRLFTFLANGVTGIRFLNNISGDPQAFERAGVLSPRVYVQGMYFSSDFGPAWHRSLTKLERPDSADAYVAAYKAAGFDFLRIDAAEVAAHRALPVLDALLAAARRAGLAIVSHDHERSFARTLALGAYGGSTEHLGWFRDTLGFRKAVYSDSLLPRDVDAVVAKIPALAAAVQRAGLWVTPTLDCIEATYAPPAANFKIVQQMVKALQDAGVGLLLGADASGLRQWPSVVHGELASLVRAGLTPYQALVTGTRNPAQHLGLLDSVGTVAVGKRADLVLLYGNPLQDIRHTREPAGVMLAGRWLDRAELDGRLLALPKNGHRLPRSWLRLGVLHGGLYPYVTTAQFKPTEQMEQLEGHVQRFEALTDSLTAAPPASVSAAARVREQLAAELGALRALLRSEQRATFDVIARVWLRAQARQGSPVTVPGVLPVP